MTASHSTVMSPTPGHDERASLNALLSTRAVQLLLETQSRAENGQLGSAKLTALCKLCAVALVRTKMIVWPSCMSTAACCEASSDQPCQLPVTPGIRSHRTFSA